MNRPRFAAGFLGSVAVACLSIIVAPSAQADPYNLSCNLSGLASGPDHYLIGVDDPTFVWQRPTMQLLIVAKMLPLTVETFDANHVKAHLDIPLTNWPAGTGRMELNIARKTGTAWVQFLSVEHSTSAGTKWRQVLTVEAGDCAKAAPAF